MARIAVGGFQHETNTFSTTPATLADFLHGGGWPGLQCGPAMREVLQGMNLPISGAIDAIVAAGHEPVPLVWCAATPSGRVEQAAFAHITGLFLEALAQCGPIDGLYLDLHGAMACSASDDGEGDFLQAVRTQLGNLPLAASLDLHANVSPAMFASCDLMLGYRTYPHVDMAACGARTAQALLQIVHSGRRPHKQLRQLDTLLPLTSQCTLVEPAASLYAALPALEQAHGAMLSLTLGFPLADVADCGPAIFAYAETADGAAQAVAALDDAFAAALPQFDAQVPDAPEAVAQALQWVQAGRRPVVLADTQDNPGGGGQMDTTGLLQTLVARNVRRAVVAVLYDPEAAALAHAAGEGATLTLALGGKLAGPGSGPAHGRYVVEKLSDGNFTGTGPMWGGMAISLGPMVLLRHCSGDGGVRVIVASRKMQAADQSILSHFGIAPADCDIIALKSSVHFRADFDRIAAATLVVASPGAVTARLAQLHYRKLRPGMRLLG